MMIGSHSMGRWLVTIAIVVVALTGCGKKHPAENVTNVADDDPRMNAAIDKARASVKTFIAALKSPKPDQSAFSIKMAFTDGRNTEHMWLTTIRFDGSKFSGTVNNDPEKVRSVQLGQKVTVAPEKISDWMYIKERKLVGGETLRVLRNAMSPAERAEFDSSVPFTID
ncbi:MAG: YegJ family protein [Gemmataceae bacterium]